MPRPCSIGAKLDAFLAKNLAVAQPQLNAAETEKPKSPSVMSVKAASALPQFWPLPWAMPFEHASNYTLKHGFAVALGILLEARLAHEQTGLPWPI